MQAIIGVDIGGTKIDVARVEQGVLCDRQRVLFDAQGTEQEIILLLIQTIEKCMNADVCGIGVGVPGMVDVEQGVVYDLVNVVSWKKVFLKKVLQEKFNVSVQINNDANCFVLGEKYYGNARYYRNVVGMSLGTGIGIGLIFDNKLYTGSNCSAGEFGQISYLKSDYEAYCSGRFFQQLYGFCGSVLNRSALEGNNDAIAAFNAFGLHLGKAISSILLAYDPQYIVIGGSVAAAFPFFNNAIEQTLDQFIYPNVVKKLIIEQSATDGVAILGAALLCLEDNTARVY